MFEGIDFSLKMVLDEVFVAFLCLWVISSLTKNDKLALLGLGFALVLGFLNTILDLPFPLYWILIIPATLGCIVFDLKRNPEVRKSIIQKLSDVERTIYILPVIVILATGIYAITSFTPLAKTTVIVPIGEVSLEIPTYWEHSVNEETNQDYWDYSGNFSHGSVILEIIEPPTENTAEAISKSLKNEVNQLYAGQLFGDDHYALISEIKKDEIVLDGTVATTYSYYYTEAAQVEEDSDYAYDEDYAKDVFFIYDNQLYRFTFREWGFRHSLFLPSAKQKTGKLANQFLKTIRFE